LDRAESECEQIWQEPLGTGLPLYKDLFVEE
jgi:hypothetical protein